jgi:NADH-quinone oxidoreductase subunit L
MSVRPHEVLLILLPGLPLAAFAAPAVPAWFGRRWSERRVSAVTVGAFAGAAIAAAVLGGLLACRGGGRLTASAGTWFGGLHLVLVADRLSLPFAGLTALTGCLIAVFSRRNPAICASTCCWPCSWRAPSSSSWPTRWSSSSPAGS